MSRTDAPATLPLLRLTDVGRSYGDHVVLRSVSLDLHPGEFVVIMGDNGSGKSTLLRVACGREQPTSGAALFDGQPVDEDAAATRSRLATVIDPGACYPDLTVREHLMLVALAHGLGDAADDAVEEALARHRLTDHADALPTALSSGQVQSLLLAAAFVRPHDLLVLDEPEQRLDSRARHDLARRLADHRDRGTAVLAVTHHEAVGAAADRVLTLEDGVLSPAGSPSGRGGPR
ncbi:ABC transporter ATP-binding protein [Streptomyces sp. CRN 30]|uniref:ABC transporter ATP-binding protein n=1 Tax=Streptomyces sp. CRN 30 TaxID=3075613 RepID=UPI002A810EFA|nr:ABC transporter ATP-binding protein [Streptomyces sp. CRN 30]